DIYDKIKPYANQKVFYRKNDIIELVKRPRFALAPIFIFLFLISLTIFSFNDSNQKRYLNGDQYLSFFTDSTQINNYITTNQENENYYLLNYRESPVLYSFQVDEKINLAANISDYFPKQINEYQEEALTIIAQDNYLFTASPKTLNIVDISNNQMKVVFTKILSNSETSLVELHLTDNYLIAVYSEYQNFDTITKMLILNADFEEVYNYQVVGQYLDSKLIENKLYLFTQVPLTNHLNNDDKVIPMPTIYENSLEKEIEASNIGYIRGFGSNAYTIITCFDLAEEEIISKDSILLSYDNWKHIYLTKNSLYLINNHQNTDNSLEYGTYTAIIRYDLEKGINYSSSFKIKGSTLNDLGCDEYNGYLRIAITSVDYKITKNLLQNKITPETLNNKIYIMKETGTGKTKRMQLVSSFEISSNEFLETAHFSKTDAYALTQNNKLYHIDLNNASKPRLESVSETQNDPLFYYPLSDNLAFTLEVNNTKNGYLLSLYNINQDNMKVWNQVHEIKYNDFNYFPVIDAFYDRNSIFNVQISDKHYLGFSVTSLTKTKGNYLLYEINPLTETFQLRQLLFSNTYPTKMIHVNQKIYAMSSNTLYLYNNSFEEIEKIKLP
ncbi:MAG: beta-propeller domain-containing protein, partial [Bacilli bacterium]|nr:beta-propeller domain-containing protein [Bacilli bacterium]